MKRLSLLVLALTLLTTFQAGANSKHEKGVLEPVSAARTSPFHVSSQTLEDYWETLAAVREDLAASGDPAQAAIILEALRSVNLPDGENLPLDHRFLVALLRQDPPEVDRALQLLDQLLAARRTWQSQPFGQNELNTLQAILSEPEFQWEVPAPNPLVELFQRFMRWLAGTLAALAPAGFSGAFLNTLVTITLGAALAWVLFRAARGVLRGVVRSADIEPEREKTRDLTSSSAIERARAAAQAGNYREGIRFLYLAALRALEENGALRPDRTRTNREVLAQLNAHPDLASRMAAVVDTFDRAWYGFRTVDEDEFRRFSRLVEELRRFRRDR